MEKIYLQMLHWLELPEDKRLEKAYGIKVQLIDYFLEDNHLAVCNFLIVSANEIDNLFGSHTSEQLLQFVW
jgi:hypothetical protein